MSLGERLKKFRDHLRKTQAEMAELLGMSITAYKNYEKDKREIGYLSLEKLASFGANPNWLLKNEGEMIAAEPCAVYLPDKGHASDREREFLKKMLDDADAETLKEVRSFLQEKANIRKIQRELNDLKKKVAGYE